MRQPFLLVITTLLLAGINLTGKAQGIQPFGFEFRAIAKVVHGTDTLRNAWAGGLNSPQFSNIDLNNDQQPDLYVFDRATTRSMTFLNVASGTGRAWQYAPEYESLFPTGLQGWALLRDYDCDSRPDLFTYANGGDIRIYRNVADASGRPSFQLVTNQLTYFDPAPLTGGNTNITAGGYNLPAIQDVNGDGRLDILTYDFASTSPSINYYRNVTTTGCGGLQFVLDTQNWGGVAICHSGCSTFSFATTQCRPELRPTHTGGYNLTVFDLDGDGDLDILTGRDNCAELVSLRNDGTPQLALMTAAGLNTSFPVGTTAARVPNFPAAYLADVTFDGRPDVLVAPNLYNNIDTVDLRRTVRLYRDGNSTGAPALSLQTDAFLQEGMLDVGEAAAPAFGDLNGDGLVDMLVGGVSRNTPNNTYRATLSYYRNVGKASKPVFQLVSSDYLGLSGRHLAGIKPMLVDLNKDGALDLVYAGFQRLITSVGTTSDVALPITYMLNTAPAGQAVAFNATAAAMLANLPAALNDAPYFTDVDGDGQVDLLLGTNTAVSEYPGFSLRYYRNTGNLSFTLVNNDYGRIRTSTGLRPGNLHPVVADFDGDTYPDLLTADGSGEVQLFSNFRAQTGAFLARTDLFFDPLSGQFQAARFGTLVPKVRFAPAVADVNQDGSPELYLGLEAGGLLSFGIRSRVLSNQNAATTLPLQLFPNPATTTVSIEAPRPVRLTLLDIMGRTLRQPTTIARTHALSLTGLAPGIYLVRCETAEGEQAVKRLVVK
ncbi:Por secretion system C-terminal sorting domain-containing protein [Hymenobacter gelipurpurascens]|uniref:Por secretion system C-terminal sorting domain-containing protein n=1 Tax=Hymenobacter gelipurpurascens TaxID=89968 RepID=A0A212UCP5_9BACT|nr:T9SS type A sorting domain-containing protein [Hymenobacter gelipurpurascens]SNC76025.1 Por secretion system C-terminal sorting domain-containing protein [Hymenobacter gelipurpurascens]